MWNFILILINFLFVAPSYSQAYLDPGTGSYVIQIAVATILGLLYVIKSFWINIKTVIIRFFSRLIKNDQKKS